MQSLSLPVIPTRGRARDAQADTTDVLPSECTSAWNLQRALVLAHKYSSDLINGK